MTTPAQLVEILRARRKARHLTQAELAQKLAISQARYSALESDPATIPLERLLTLVKLLGFELVIQERPSQSAAETEW